MYAQVTAVRPPPGPECRHSDTEEVSGKRSVHPGRADSHPGASRPDHALSTTGRTRRPTTRYVHGFVHETWRDAPKRGRHGGLTRTLADRSARSARSPETARDVRDARRMAHNPEVAGSNPAPATSFRRCVSRTQREAGCRQSFLMRCCVRDEGWPFGVALRGEASNRPLLR